MEGGGREIGNSKLRKDRRFGLWIMDGRKIKNITSILRKTLEHPMNDTFYP